MSAFASLVFIGVTLFPALSYAWPTTDQWIGVYKGGGPIQDPVNDAGGARNIVDSSGHYSAYTYYDGTYFYTRLRLDADPTGSGGQGYLLQYGWGEEFDTDQNAASYEWLTMVDGIGDHAVNNGDETIQLRQNTAPTNIGDPSDKAEVLNSWLDLGGNFQISLADTVTNGDADYYLDFRFPYSTLKTALGIDDYAPIRILFGSSSSTQSLVENGADLCGGTGINLYTGLSDFIVPLGGTRPTDGSVLFVSDIYGNGDVTEINAGSTIYVKVTDADRNINLTGLDTVTVTVTVPSGDSETITLTETGNNTGVFTASLPTAGSATHTINDGALQVTDGESATATYTDRIAANLSRDVPRTDTCLIHAPSVSVTKSVSPSRVVAGETVTYTITLHNAGGSAAPVSTVTDTLPAGFSYVTYSTTGMTTVEPSVAGQTLTWSGAWSIPASGTLTLTFQANASATDGNYFNNASFSGTGYPSPITGNTASVEVVHLGITKAASVSRVITGGTVTYTLTLSSSASTAVPVTQVTDTLPAGFSYQTGTTTGLTTANPTVSGQTLAWTPTAPATSWTLPAHGSLTVTFNATASSTAGTYYNNASFSPTGFTPRTTGNTAAVEVVALVITKTANPTQVVKGGNVKYTIVMTNSSVSPVTVTQVTDTLTGGFTYASMDNSGSITTIPNPTGASPVWTGPWTLPAASGGSPGSLTLIFNATAPNSVGGPYSDTATFTATGFPAQSSGATADVNVIAYALTKSVSPSLVLAGGTVTYTLTFNNSTNSDETITQIKDTLPSGFSYVAGTTGGTLGVTANPGVSGQTLTWPSSGAGSWTLTKNSSLTLTFQATASSTPGVHYNNADWTASKTVKPTGNTAPVTVYDLTIAKTVNNSEVLAGDTVRYTITLTNTGGPAATVTQVTDTLPAGFTYVGPTSGLTANNPSISGQTLTWSTGGPWTLPASTGGVPTTLTLTFDAAASSTDGTYTNNATFTATGYPVRTVTGTAPVKVRHLTIAKAVTAATPSSVVAGGTVSYTMTLTNTGTTAVPVTRVTDTLPGASAATNFTYVTGTSAGMTTADPSMSGQVLTWNGAWSIPAGGTLTLTFQATAGSTDGTYDNNASFTPTGFPVRSTGNTATVTVIHLSMSKSVDLSSVVAGATVKYTLTLSSTSSSAVPVTQVKDTLPAGFAYVSMDGTGSITSAPSSISGQDVTWNGAWSIPAGGTLTLKFNATASTTDSTYYNTARFTPTGYPVQTVNNTAPVTVIHLSITKSVNPASALVGQLVAYTITLSSTSGSAVQVTQVTDTLPAGFTYKTGSTTGMTTSDPSGTTGTITWNGSWSIPAGGSLMLNMQANASATAGTYLNNATFTPTGYPVQSTGPTASLVVATDPVITLTKSVDKATAKPGDQLTYTVYFHNTGGSAASFLIISDPVPFNASYVAGSLKMGDAASIYATAAQKTDAQGDDEAEISGGSAIFMVGTVPSDDGVAGSGNDEGKVYFKVTVDY